MAFTQSSSYHMSFTADVAQARAQIQSLISTLSNLSAAEKMANPIFGDSIISTKDFQKASLAASQLSTHFQKAFNQETGKLNLGILDESLKKSGQSLSALTSEIASSGKAGAAQFVQISRALADAEKPAKSTAKWMKDLQRSLKNTLYWSISSTAMNSMVGSFQKAVGFAKELDRSLNNIRIVSGSSAQEMADFAKYANTAAKRLGTTTTRFTDSALLFRQQGLQLY